MLVSIQNIAKQKAWPCGDGNGTICANHQPQTGRDNQAIF
jgi:hypothetical protein